MNFIKTLIILNILIFIHELGHYLAARAAGVHVKEFAIGFGSKIFSFSKGGTTYSLRLIPLGGYCNLQGMTPDDVTEDEGNFLNKSVLWRMLIILAGPLMNLAFTLLVLIFLFVVLIKLPIGTAIITSFDEIAYMFSAIFKALLQISAGNTADLVGPVGIVNIVSEVAQTYDMLFYLVAVISLNLSIMNLLPIPGLDGSRIIFLLLEAIQKKPINPKKEAFVHSLGFVFLLIVMLFVTYQDIMRLLSKGGGILW